MFDARPPGSSATLTAVPGAAAAAHLIARLFARLLAALAAAAGRRADEWRRAHLRRSTENALRGLDPHTLRDIGLTPGEISSAAAEVAGDVEATRLRVWREIGARVV
ncbi:MAG: DUF1127 domain-containing protein [Betaproteobacteria bacterium]|nr:DUF1127 domain-containing protein [Betaproteobacteria bacterium]MCC6246164.1 DUF1127 domain-containing protein [Rubrivivax sp.]MCL4695797.1 DUF1127 domain-containing protein [Burkholderiaceae bacterium]